ncbi:hypothetical protein FQN60_011611 [Etheostoma spectabile]|uniref:Uncharacterized protein n=1 Tax=Etheostoma spectabile TaxID=54343 RepID=A0A5J5DM19_9PERO|nr:hypothetical protein FQN60_011611 [Etheostoma spectabile]
MTVHVKIRNAAVYILQAVGEGFFDCYCLQNQKLDAYMSTENKTPFYRRLGDTFQQIFMATNVSEKANKRLYFFRKLRNFNTDVISVDCEKGGWVLILLLACFPCRAILINTEPLLLAAKQSPEVARSVQMIGVEDGVCDCVANSLIKNAPEFLGCRTEIGLLGGNSIEPWLMSPLLLGYGPGGSWLLLGLLVDSCSWVLGLVVAGCSWVLCLVVAGCSRVLGLVVVGCSWAW